MEVGEKEEEILAKFLALEEVNSYYHDALELYQYSGKNFSSRYEDRGYRSNFTAAIFQEIIDRIASTTYSNFPQFAITDDNGEIQPLLENNERHLDREFSLLAIDYALGNLAVGLFEEDTGIFKRILPLNVKVEVADYSEEIKNFAIMAVVTEADILDAMQLFEYKLEADRVWYYYLDGERIMIDGNKVVGSVPTINTARTILYNRSTPSFLRIKNKLSVLNVLNSQIENDCQHFLKTTLLYNTTNADAVKKVFSNANSVCLQHMSIKDLSDNLQFMSNEAVYNNIETYNAQIDRIKLEMYELLTLNEVMSGKVLDDVVETRIAAANKVHNATMIWRFRQKKLNSFFEIITQEFLKNVLGGEVSVQIDMDSVSFIDKQEREDLNEQNMGKIINLMQQIEQVLVNVRQGSIQPNEALPQLQIYIALGNEIISKRGLSATIIQSFNALGDAIESNLKAMVEQAQQEASQPPPPDPDSLRLQADLARSEAQTKAMEANAELTLAKSDKTKVEAETIPQTLALKQQQQVEDDQENQLQALKEQRLSWVEKTKAKFNSMFNKLRGRDTDGG